MQYNIAHNRSAVATVMHTLWIVHVSPEVILTVGSNKCSELDVALELPEL